MHRPWAIRSRVKMARLGADANKYHANHDLAQMRGQHQRQAGHRYRDRAPDRGPRAKSRDRPAGEERRDDRGQEHE